ncbi:MAG: hypothetical protein ACREO0_16040 [Pseudoxanthomonas sp.]
MNETPRPDRPAPRRRDVHHELQLLRDLGIINARTVAEFGPLPSSGLPVQTKRKPNLLHPAHPVIEEDDPMKLSQMAVAASIALAACSPVDESSRAEQSKGVSEARDADKPLRKFNPNPKRAYTITMTIQDAPGPFAAIEGVAQYDVENAPECGRYLESAGLFPDMTSMETFPLTKVSDTEYQGTVYADLLLDEDYFGRGVCRWKFMQAQVVLKATGAKEETEFLPSLRADSVYKQKSETRFFWKERYPREEGYDNFPEFGDESLERVPNDKRNEFFTIVITSKDAQP